ncbi:MAG: cobalamin-dependent protein [Chitinispirillaceae bacterium]|nr:cobalamin-dependent protein [Chitinispirillaceae bacterium]
MFLPGMKKTQKTYEESKIDVLLTYPKDGLRLFQSMIPIGLVSIGTVLQRAGYRVAVIDFNHYSNDFRRQLQFLRPKIIGIGGTTPSRKGSFLTARLAKQSLPHTPVVYGGINATFTAAEVLDNIPEIDFIIKGEGELSFPALCDAHIRGVGSGISCLPGLCFRNGSRIIENKPERIRDLSVLPFPDRDLLGDYYNLDMEFIGGPGDFIITSRGCPAACNFCSASRMFPGGIRLRPVDSVMAEIEYLLSRKNLSGLKLFDSTFTANRKHVEDFCNHVGQFKIPWECEIRADSVDAGLLKLMKDSGCYYINIGMETSHESHLKRISKGITSGQVLDVLSMCKRLGIHSKVFFTFGHLGQTFRECLEDIQFIDRHKGNIDFFAVTVGLRIYPGTRLESECRENGVLREGFSWTESCRKASNLLVGEPSDIPLLFQKQLGPVKLMTVLAILFAKKFIGTEKFLARMMFENIGSVLISMKLAVKHSIHKAERRMGRSLKERAWAGTVYHHARDAGPSSIQGGAGVSRYAFTGKAGDFKE